MTEPAGLYRAGTGEPLVLVHPAESSWHAWRPVLASLAEHYDVHALTLPGHFGAAPLPGPVSVESFADALEGYLDAAGLATAHLAGNSLGGILAVEMVRRGRARSAVSFSGPSAAADDRAALRLLRQFQIGAVFGRLPLLPRIAARNPAFRQRFLATLMVHGDRVTSAEFAEFISAGRNSNIGVPLVRHYRRGGAPVAFDVGDVPVVIAWGSQDRVVPLDSFGVPSHRLIRGSELRVIDGVGHIPMWDDPQMVIQVIREATTRVPQS
jgi:pimeloyl-ACP methyl ester carboxylesterase